ncbi:MAG: hypothetical protein KatS3mg038_0403 [Candidatus Kapaibacterium sp.]|nr:MAG: hypothetical protein KatS3mg038_0403 [Candidatus Kapabacteria bacterium]
MIQSWPLTRCGRTEAVQVPAVVDDTVLVPQVLTTMEHLPAPSISDDTIVTPPLLRAWHHDATRFDR